MRQVRIAIAEIIALNFPEYTFEYGRVQDINKYVSDVANLAWLFPITASNGTNSRARLNRTFNVTLAFLSVDEISSNNVQSNVILEDNFDKAEEFLIRLYLNAEANQFEPSESYGTENVFKLSAKGIFTGVQLTFSVTLPDQLEIC
jgi:hypothetical protein